MLLRRHSTVTSNGDKQCVKKPHEILTDLRTGLFFDRDEDHSGDDPDAQPFKYIQKLLALIRAKVTNESISNDDTVEKS